MNKELKKIIEASSFKVVAGDYIYAKVNTFPEQKNHFFVSKDKDEITVVTKKENVKDLELIEINKDTYSLVSLNVSVPFYSVGFLATVSSAIAKSGLNILIISTYSKDYIMIKKSKLKTAEIALLELGFKKARKH